MEKQNKCKCEYCQCSTGDYHVTTLPAGYFAVNTKDRKAVGFGPTVDIAIERAKIQYETRLNNQLRKSIDNNEERNRRLPS